ncbi:MAG: SIMPL domain-containing protein, partial [Pseudomonadota bacterium]
RIATLAPSIAAILAMLAQLDGAGVAPEDVRTGAVRLQPRYSSSSLSSGNQILGYVAVNTVTVDLRDLDRLGPLLQALIGDGANRLDDVRFGLQDPTDALDEARRRAVAEAMRRAALYADAAGVELGAVLSLSDTGGAGYQPLRAEMAMMDMAQSAPDFAIPTAPGDIEMSVSVSMVFAIAG